MFRNMIDDAITARRAEAMEMDQKWRENSHHFLPLLEKLDGLPCAAAITMNPGDDGCLFIRLAGNAADLTLIVRAFRTTGWHTMYAGPPEAKQSSWSALWRLHKAGGEEADDVPGVEIYFSFSSTVCRRVLVGKKMVEQDVYETVCGDDEAAAS